MKVFSSPAEVIVDPSLNLTSLVERHRANSADPVLYRRQMSPGNWQPVRASEFYRMVADLAKGMIAAGIRPGDRVGIMSRTRFEWTVIDFAIWYAGAISVPVYETNAPARPPGRSPTPRPPRSSSRMRSCWAASRRPRSFPHPPKSPCS